MRSFSASIKFIKAEHGAEPIAVATIAAWESGSAAHCLAQTHRFHPALLGGMRWTLLGGLAGSGNHPEGLSRTALVQFRSAQA